MNCQIQGLSIHAEVHGTAEPALMFLHYWGIGPASELAQGVKRALDIQNK